MSKQGARNSRMYEKTVVEPAKKAQSRDDLRGPSSQPRNGLISYIYGVPKQIFSRLSECYGLDSREQK
jgi:hypothetical protein